EKDTIYFASAVDRLKVFAVDAIVYHVNARHAELITDNTRVLRANRHDPRSLRETGPLKAFHLPPLPLQKQASQRSSCRIVIALPKKGIDIVGHHHSAHSIL